jgi:hypothetical protein
MSAETGWKPVFQRRHLVSKIEVRNGPAIVCRAPVSDAVSLKSVFCRKRPATVTAAACLCHVGLYAFFGIAGMFVFFDKA